MVAPELVLAKYVQALEQIKAPSAYMVAYTFAHHGARPQSALHQIFREGSHERDELISYNGEKLTRPQVRVFTRHHDPYAVTALAPLPETYAFTYVGEAKQGKNLVYVFNAFARATPSYEVTRFVVDGKTFLPLEIEFRAKTGTIVGTGKVTYAKTEQFWMPQSATARADVNGSLETEQISWTRYQFFTTFPPETFAEPHAPQRAPS